MTTSELYDKIISNYANGTKLIKQYDALLNASRAEVRRLQGKLKDANNLINSGYCKKCDSAVLIRHHRQLTARNNDVAEMVEALKPFADIVSEIEHREDNMLATALLSDCKNAEKILAKHATPDDKDVG